MELTETYNIWYNFDSFMKKNDKIASFKFYEFKNIIERYLISYYNNIPGSYDKLCNELREKNIELDINLENLNFKKKIFDCDINTLRKDDNYIYFENFKYKMNSRISYLIEKTSLKDVCILCLKYASLNPGGQQWGIPFATADHLYNLNFINEGFASPINSRLIEKNKFNFCSLFYDIDVLYGSIGSFFDTDLCQYEGNWSINPPMIESIINKMADKILTTLNQNKKISIFVSLANWRDSEGYQKLLSSQYLQHYSVLPPGIAYYNDSDKNIIPINTYSVAYFILGKPVATMGLRETWLYNSNAIEKLNIHRKTFYLFNDRKFTPFGTKYRAMKYFIPLQKAKKINELIYVGPTHALGGYALAYGCMNHEINVRLFLSGSSIPDHGLNFPKKILDNFNFYKKSLKDCYDIAKDYLEKNVSSKEIPFGMNDKEYIECLKKALIEDHRVQEVIEKKPKRMWLAVGSGVILSILLEIFPETDFHCVQVGKSLRLVNKRITLYYSPEKFTENAHIKPPYPCLLNYDAKIWQHIIKYGQDNDFIWNIY